MPGKILNAEKILAILVCFLLPVWVTGLDFYSIKFTQTWEDISQIVWNTQYFSDQLLSGRNPFLNEVFLYPQKTSLWMHAYTPIFGLINCIFKHPVFSINVTILINFILLTTGFYKLAGYWLKQPLYRTGIAFVALYNGYMLAKLGVHYNLLLMGLVPWNIYYFMKGFESNKPAIANRKYFMIARVLMILNFVLDYYAVFFVLVFCGILYLYRWFLKPWFAAFTVKKLLYLTIVLFGLHVIWRVMYLHGFDHKGGLWEAADIRHLFIPDAGGRFLHADIQYVNSPVTENFVFIGYTLLVFFFISMVFLLKNRLKDERISELFFVLLLLLGVVFPNFKWDGLPVFFAPTAFIHYVPFLDNMRAPSRFIELLIVLLAILVFYIFERKFQIAWSKYIWMVLFLIGIYFDFSVKKYQEIRKERFEVSAIDQRILSGKLTLTLPFGIRDGIKGIGEFNTEDYKLSHIKGIRLFSGYFSRISTQAWEKINSDSFILSVLEVQNGVHSDAGKFIKQLRTRGVGVVRVDWAKMQFNNIEKARITAIFQSENYRQESDTTNHIEYFFQL